MPTASTLVSAAALLTTACASAQTAYQGTGGPIPDNDDIGNLAAAVVDESYPITSIEVRILGLDHGYSSDLTIELRHNASGQNLTLLSNLRNGEDADFDGDYTFADAGADLWSVAAGFSGTQDLPPGVYRPSGANNAPRSLDSAFVGLDAEGAWVLRVYDDDFLVAGAFDSWELVLGGRPACPGDIEGDLDGDGAVGLSDLLTLLASFGESCDG
jgi:subtilisin-like proprotein convertase family protein